MFYLTNTLLISSYFDSFMFLVSEGKRLLSVCGGMWVEHPYVEICPYKPASPEAISSAIQSGSIFGVSGAPARSSPVIGCKWDSIETSWHTSDNQPPMLSRISLCGIEGKPPFGQEKHRRRNTFRCGVVN